MSEEGPLYRRILLKLSGEALMGGASFGIDPSVLDNLAQEFVSLHKLGVEIGVVIGGGNFFRGLSGVAQGFDRVQADYIGMLATVINSLALEDRLRREGLPVKTLSALEVKRVVDPFVRQKALSYLSQGTILILAAGTGNPYFTTDTAATLRALEIKAQALFKATKVDGVFSADPEKDPRAKKFDYLSYDEVLEKGLRVMDFTAITLAKENHLPILVFNMQKPGNILRAVKGEKVGTLVGGEKR